jgi:hypothetical protein
MEQLDSYLARVIEFREPEPMSFALSRFDKWEQI